MSEVIKTKGVTNKGKKGKKKRREWKKFGEEFREVEVQGVEVEKSTTYRTDAVKVAEVAQEKEKKFIKER